GASQPLPERGAAGVRSRDVAGEEVALADEGAGDEGRLDGRRPGKDRDGQTGRHDGGDEPGPGVVDGGEPRVARERDPLAAQEAGDDGSDAGGPVVPVVALEPRVDAVAVEKDARPAGV